jgi:hypothetical protein
MEPTNIIKAEGNCKALNIKDNCNCNVEGFQNNDNKQNDNMVMNLINKLPISIENLRAIMWGIIAVVFLYLIYSFYLKKE